MVEAEEEGVLTWEEEAEGVLGAWVGAVVVLLGVVGVTVGTVEMSEGVTTEWMISPELPWIMTCMLPSGLSSAGSDVEGDWKLPQAVSIDTSIRNVNAIAEIRCFMFLPPCWLLQESVKGKLYINNIQFYLFGVK